MRNGDQEICFILMPFGEKEDSQGERVDFDLIYNEIIAPAVKDCGIMPLRADEEASSGIIHRDMFERLILCQFAIVDLTILNANVYYELGIRHALRRNSTIIIADDTLEPPFDIAPLRISHYRLKNGQPLNKETDREELSRVLGEAQSNSLTDSPIFQLLDLPDPDISRLKTDKFREEAQYDGEIKEKLRVARGEGSGAVKDVLNKLQDPPSAGVATDILLSLRATKSWQELIDFTENVSAELAGTTIFLEQKSLALARLGRYQEAARLLSQLIEKKGGTSERCGILGGIYKRAWQNESRKTLKESYLKQAIEAYREGLFLDWRDAYPGINFLTLSFVDHPLEEEEEEILALVSFAVKRRLEEDGDFWDLASLLEINALQGKKDDIPLAKALLVMREDWEALSLIENLKLIKGVRESRGLEALSWLDEAISLFQEKKASSPRDENRNKL